MYSSTFSLTGPFFNAELFNQLFYGIRLNLKPLDVKITKIVFADFK